ncbi:protein kinase [Chloroflexota bacterium]
MRATIRRITAAYKSAKLEGQDEGYVLYSGQDPDSKLPVSIKILPRLLGSDPQIAARFRDLAQTIRQLNHPNIASVRKVGEESGLPYLITRTIEKGHSLAIRLDQPWAVDMAADVVMQAGQALEHAYKKGIVHGSLSPEKIVVEDNGRVMVTDFGLEELRNLLGAQVKEATSPYAAPERAAGEAADSRADVYSLAAILYSMLAKRDPQVVQGQVLPPSRFNPDVPPTMDAVVVKALAPDPADRYPNVRAFLAALGSVTLAPMVKKRPPAATHVHCPRCGAGAQTGRFCRRCGTPLERQEAADRSALEHSKLDEPIQITKVEVGHVPVGRGVEVHKTIIAHPMSVATGDLSDQFPEPLEMPSLETSDLWPTMGDQPLTAMPEPPPMPVIDWAEIAPPMPEVPTIEDSSVSQDDS